ncbi:hypothetical protein PR202_gb29450 [Eleusine coracana subsp. coracana]|uniref:Uncharacterized protein n=1 Tax=Eleusine coracana subsp. coracana TaxID=191504 RepID=A0AAV5G1E7_ELECO|nr:hypothetical protein PR202_gb29450 [Eleusine coracana subsp. coracana]
MVHGGLKAAVAIAALSELAGAALRRARDGGKGCRRGGSGQGSSPGRVTSGGGVEAAARSGGDARAAGKAEGAHEERVPPFYRSTGPEGGVACTPKKAAAAARVRVSGHAAGRGGSGPSGWAGANHARGLLGRDGLAAARPRQAARGEWGRAGPRGEGGPGRILEKINNPHYLYRMTILQAMSLLAPVMGAEITCQKLLPVIINSSKDRVPNIKFNVAKVLQSLIPILDQSVVEKTVKPCLVELSEDPDVDVRYFANQALQACDQMMVSS